MNNNKYVTKLKADSKGYLYSFFRNASYKINAFFCTKIMHFRLYIQKINIGNSPIFWGLSCFYRAPESIITIGNHCLFDSAKYHNLVGLTNSCIISTVLKAAKLEIGNFVGFSGVRIGCHDHIEIGNNSLIGGNVLITDSDWHPLNPDIRHESGDAIKTQPVIIGENVFIGANSIILKGAIIGDNSVIGAGSVVSGIIPPNVIAAGNPCKVIKSL